MTEAFKCGVDYMFNTLNASIVGDYCVDGNIGSARVMEKAGLVLTGEWEAVNNRTNRIEKRKQYSKKIIANHRTILIS